MTTVDRDVSDELARRVKQARESATSLAIQGGGSKRFFSVSGEGEALAVTEHCGIVNYEPTELVITARAGTRLAEIESTLEDRDQMLAFEPPHFGKGATLGGTLACGFSGPRRPYCGSARDFVLGTRVLNGRGERLRFGGEVMKNVAGYDVSRLMVGALGTLGVILEASLKVLPRPDTELTVVQDRESDDALDFMSAVGGKPYPLSAACYDGNRLYLRLSGASSAVQAAARRIGGDPVDHGETFWHSVREHTHKFFVGEGPVWRISVPTGAPALDLAGPWFFDWGGAQRWFRGDHDVVRIRAAADAAGGHATAFRDAAPGPEVFHPLPAAAMRLHQGLKSAFDPDRVLNRNRLYTGL